MELNKLPELQTEYFLASERWLDVDIEPNILDFSKPYRPPQWTLSNQGVLFAPKGDLHGICGVSGNGKSWLVVQLVTALLKGDFGTLKCELPEPPSVLLVDTEQSEDTVISVKHRICNLCGINPQVPSERFTIITLRECDVSERFRKIIKATHSIKPDVLFIDGILDLLEDFNDLKECSRIVSELMQLATHFGISVWCVIHTNPNGEKMTGHLGSAFLRKATSIFRCEKQPKGTEVFFEVSQTKARGKDVPSWTFEVLPLNDFGVVQMIGDTPQEPDNLPQQAIEGTPPKDYDWLSDMGVWLAQALNDGALSEPCSLAEVRNVLKQYGGITNNTRLQKDCQALRNHNVLRPQPKREWQRGQRYPKYTLNLD